ncbi:hypothetical protein Dimus_001407, partial [Dionaea muscipula]
MEEIAATLHEKFMAISSTTVTTVEHHQRGSPTTFGDQGTACPVRRSSLAHDADEAVAEGASPSACNINLNRRPLPATMFDARKQQRTAATIAGQQRHPQAAAPCTNNSDNRRAERHQHLH